MLTTIINDARKGGGDVAFARREQNVKRVKGHLRKWAITRFCHR